MGAKRRGRRRGWVAAWVGIGALLATTGGAIGPGTADAAVGTAVAAGSVSVTEGNTGAARAVQVRVTLSRPSTTTVTVDATLAAGSAVAGTKSPADFQPWAAPRKVEFAAGTTVKLVKVSVLPDKVAEGNETAFVLLSAPTGGAVLGRSTATVTIVDDDSAPASGLRASIGSAAIAEGDAGPARPVTLRVNLSDPAPGTVTVVATLTAGTATAGTASPSDVKLWKAPLTVTLKAGQVGADIPVTVFPDAFVEPVETATLRLSAPTGGLALGVATGTVTIDNDDDLGGQLTTGPAVAAACSNSLIASDLGRVAAPELKEISGIDAGVRNPGALWVHNDSGDSPRVFAVNTAGATLRQYAISGASANDWEDMEVGGGPVAGTSYLYLGDIGDNARARAEVAVYRVAEPAVTTGAPTSLTGAAKLRLKYPDGPHDAEALMADPVTGELVIIAKTTTGAAGIYRAPAGLAAGSLTTMSLVGTLTLPSGSANAVTSADVSADGAQIVVRTYGSVLLWGRGSGPIWAPLTSAPCRGPVPAESQGEAVGFLADGAGYVTVSEGTNPVIHRYLAP